MPDSAPAPIALTDAAFTIAGHKVTTHTLAVIAGALLAVLGPIIAARWPAAAPVIDEARKVLPTPQLPARTPEPTSAYEASIRAAWEIEHGATAAWMKRLIYLYRGSLEMVKAAKTKTELQKAFAAEEERLNLKDKLPFVRSEIRKEWIRVVPDSEVIDETQRQKIADVMVRTIAILERLP